MEQIKFGNTESTEIKDTTTANQPQTPLDAPNTPPIEAKPQETASKSTETAALTGERKHTVIYLAGGIWCDSTGKYWCRDQKKNCVSSMTFTDSELDSRADIKYMIEYGAMKDVIVE